MKVKYSKKTEILKVGHVVATRCPTLLLGGWF